MTQFAPTTRTRLRLSSAVENLQSYLALGTFAVVIGGIIVRLVNRINTADKKAELASDKAQEVAIELAASKITQNILERDLTNHRVEVAREYASRGMLENLETKIVGAIGQLGDRIDNMMQRKSA
jgi:hypothetical protein